MEKTILYWQNELDEVIPLRKWNLVFKHIWMSFVEGVVANTNLEILHRTNSVGVRRHKFSPAVSEMCPLCYWDRNSSIPETHGHLILNCPSAQRFWQHDVLPLIRQCIPNITLTDAYRALGFSGTKYTKSQCIQANFICQYARYTLWYIAINSYQNSQVAFAHGEFFMDMIQKRLVNLRSALAYGDWLLFRNLKV